jgi:hypothetical protein
VSAQRNVLFSVLLVLAFFLLCIIWRWAARTSSETQKNRRDAEQQIYYAYISLGHARRAHRRGQLSRRNQSPSSSTSTYTQGDIVSSLWATQACQCLNTAQKILQASTDTKLEKKRDPKLNPRFGIKGDDEESDDQAVTRGPQNENLSVSQIRSEAKKYQLVNHGGEVCPCVARGPEAKYMGTA